MSLGASWREVNAGDAGTGKQVRETFFRCAAAQRHTVQQQLRPRSAEQQTRFAAIIQRRAQLFPRGFELPCGTHVSKFVEPRKLQQDVQAANKRPRRLSSIARHAVLYDLLLPLH
jgi:hypothetical protein